MQEYLLVVKPGAAVSEKIIAEKNILYNDYKIEMPADIKPHINVAAFSAREEMEETLIRWIQRICSMQNSFLVTLNNYSGFPPHTIYLRVQNPEPFQQLSQQLKAINDFIFQPSPFIIKPHASMATKLKERIYEKAMFEYSQKTFHESFMVNELILIKKESQLAVCKTLNVFHFLPVNELV
jgi:2'-5' RNA ligase superfamily protein